MSSPTPDYAIVTGTSGGLGRAITARLVEDGFRVVGIARRAVTAADIGTDGANYVHVEYDLGDIDGISDLVRGIVAEHGKPFGLVNNAALGTDGLLATLHNTAIEDLVRVNVTAPLILTKFVVRQMLARKRGRVVNISSIVARTGYRGLAAYGATKAAMEGMTRSLARDVGRRGVTVNAVAPGFLETQMTAGLSEVNLDRIATRSALGRFAAVDEVAAGVSFLLSDAGAGITGTTITIDGGSTA
ncbi:SDR family NAD(P)-dependent oxidoreductase [Jatrophihabitans fulvus]